MKTISLEPLAFEIEDYLTEDECNAIIAKAIEIGLQKSITHKDADSRSYHIFDIDKDQLLDLDEMRVTLEQNHDVNLNDEDIIEMYRVLGVDTNGDHKLSRSEMYAFSPDLLHQYIKYELLPNSPWKHSRFSDQSWLFHPKDYTESITNIHHRLYDLFDLYSIPQYILEDSYPLQVVHYGVNGKYNAHYDSADADREGKCCHTRSAREKRRNMPCKSCRFMTVLYYLSTAEEGGDTVFPLSNQEDHNKRFNEAAAMNNEEIELDGDDDLERYHSIHWRMSKGNLPEVYCSADADNLKVSAVRGKAVIWFNHLVDGETKWMGAQDVYSMHTGCPVLKGEKWIANHWIQVDDIAPDGACKS